MTRRVVVLLLPGVHLLDVAGPAQVFDTAREFGHGYDLVFAAPPDGGRAGEVTSAQGLTFARLAPPPEVGPGDLVLVPGVRVWEIGEFPSLALPPRLLDPDTAAWLRAALAAGAEVASVCSGALVLGEAGLLSGRRATTHHLLTDLLRERCPAARVEENVLFVRDGPVTTSAGIASGLDMALAMLERAHGPILAARVARALVVYLRRDGAETQRSVYLEYRTHLHRGVHRAQDFLAAHAARRVPLAELAREANLSGRHLARAFKEATALTPLQYQHLLRLEAARPLLRDPRLGVEEVARRVGFQDARQFRRLWTRHFGAAPSAGRGRTPVK